MGLFVYPSVGAAGPKGDPGDLTSVYSLGTNTSGTLDLSLYPNGGVFHLTLGANITAITLPAQSTTQQRVFELVITQDATGSRTVTWPANTRWSEGNAPILSTVAASIDTVAIIQDGVRVKARLVERSLA